ncbi:TetR/AcrR family transcriptional regulator [Peribacillus frigoritolerans]|uniref:TetR/AcrR family transcriptional regulator n=1 Tax=Peribacillus frigoritolerans TaxID=450367 RepID=UPI0021CFE090|nr:TetR/AcrR family transcriptional regulator [Peribacillus frigoritolerans]MCU6598953.1 TetR/AcrR family transcriptional regulator [Peribacillus frigoritolerans]
MVKISTKQRIIDTAVELFEQKGFHGVGIEEIIEVSKTSKGGFYYNFKSKEELLFTIHEQYINITLENGYKCYNEWNTPIERLTALIRNLLIGIDENISSVTVFFHDYKYLTGDYFKVVERQRDEYVQIMLKVLEEGIQSKEIRSELPIKMLAMAIFGIIDWTYMWYKKGGFYSIEEISDIFIDIIINSVLTDDVKAKKIYEKHFLKNKNMNF